MPAPERIPPGGVTPPASAPPGPASPGTAPVPVPAPAAPPAGAAARELLSYGELTVRGRVREASNAVLYCAVELDGVTASCVYKPVAGERPLWDFPDGTLARREVAAYEVSEATGWDLVPPTVLRDGPYGEGMCQLWIEADPAAELLALVEGEEAGPGWKAVGPAELGGGRTALLVHADDPRLRRLAVLDAVLNNADRKGGHLLPTADGRLYAIDHGVTFNAEDKLRTLLWGWAGEPLPGEAVEALGRLGTDLADGGPLGARLSELITPVELGALRVRVSTLLAGGRHPLPSGRWPAIPWPPL
ncbi:SCO1664 family protein [Streptomyces sp. URMC 123]|uniref:SCO1664 family protein n=1 Tax=Streptomyces sp. URMC 123 TaxID=3423403 RepID=UPI003F1C8517